MSADYSGYRSSGKISATKSKKHLAMCTSWPRICRIYAFFCHEVHVSDNMSTSWPEPTHYPAVKTYVSETPYSHIWSPSVIPSTHQATSIKVQVPVPTPKIVCSHPRPYVIPGFPHVIPGSPHVIPGSPHVIPGLTGDLTEIFVNQTKCEYIYRNMLAFL